MVPSELMVEVRYEQILRAELGTAGGLLGRSGWHSLLSSWCDIEERNPGEGCEAHKIIG